jgi:hypothetical protein
MGVAAVVPSIRAIRSSEALADAIVQVVELLLRVCPFSATSGQQFAASSRWARAIASWSGQLRTPRDSRPGRFAAQVDDRARPPAIEYGDAARRSLRPEASPPQMTCATFNRLLLVAIGLGQCASTPSSAGRSFAALARRPR